MIIIGDVKTRKVYSQIGTKKTEIHPSESQEVINHSPDGFAWGYGGSGPAQLALAILLLFMSTGEAFRLYQKFKFDVIAGVDKDKNLYLSSSDINDWIRRNQK